MCVTTQNFTIVPSIFGSGYIPEMHGDKMPNYLSPAEHSIRYPGAGSKKPTGAIFDELMKSLRSALSLR